MIVRNKDKVVVYNNDWILSSEGAFNKKENKRDKKINLSNASYYDIECPLLWGSGYYTYVDKFYLTDTGLAAAKSDKKGNLKSKFLEVSERPIVDTGLGFNAQGGYRDLVNLQTGSYLKRDEPVKFRDANNVTREITLVQFHAIIDMIIANGARIMHNKWDLFDAIEAASTEEELNAININEGW